jgi:hypothetical protein
MFPFTAFCIVIAVLIIFAGGYKLGQKFPHPKLVDSEPNTSPPAAGVTTAAPSPK